MQAHPFHTSLAGGLRFACHAASVSRARRTGGAIAPGVRWTDASTELGLRLTFDVGGTEVQVEVEIADRPRPHAARSARLYFSYRVDGDGATLAPAAGMALCRAVAARAAANEARVLDAIARDAAARREEAVGSARV
jgi:hypothetical protein